VNKKLIEDACKKCALILYEQNVRTFIDICPKNIGLYSQLIVYPPEREEQIKELNNTVNIIKKCTACI
jgi:hypothetical protein